MIFDIGIHAMPATRGRTKIPTRFPTGLYEIRREMPILGVISDVRNPNRLGLNGPQRASARRPAKH
jgi:hypothetical protein